MLILNTKFQKLLQEQFRYTDEFIQEMVMEYRMGILSLIMDHIQIFIERKHLTDIDKSISDRIEVIRKQVKGDIESHKELYTEYFSVITKYPELQEIIKTEIDDLNESLNNDLVESLNDEGKMKLLDIIEEDMKVIKENQDYAKELMQQFQTK